MLNAPDTILLIDDDYATNYLHKRFFNKSDFDSSIMIASDGQEGIDILMTLNEQVKDDAMVVIILDINMPVMDGWTFLEVFEEVRSQLNYKTALLMVSSSINPDDRKRAEDSPIVDRYISKPLTQDSLDMIRENFS